MLGFTSLELVHYSLTVPSDCRQWLCHTNTHTRTHTHKQKNAHVELSSELKLIVLLLCFVPSIVFKKWTVLPERERQTERDQHEVFMKTATFNIARQKQLTLLLCWYSLYRVSVFYTHSQMALALLTLHSVWQRSFFLFQTFSF